MLTHIRMTDNRRIGLAGAIFLALLPGWLACQEPDVPAPGDHLAAFRRADSYYGELFDIMADARDALRRDDLPAFERSVRSYRVTVVLATVWHARACWPTDHGGRNVAFVMQATMGETLVGWSMAERVMSSAAGRELMREINLDALSTHEAKIREVRDEMRARCGARRARQSLQ